MIGKSWKVCPECASDSFEVVQSIRRTSKFVAGKKIASTTETIVGKCKQKCSSCGHEVKMASEASQEKIAENK